MIARARRDYTPMVARVARAIPRHTEDGRLDAAALAARLDLDMLELRRHLRALERRGVRVPEATGTHSGGDARALRAIPRFIRDGRLRCDELAAHLGLSRRAVSMCLHRLRRSGEQIPPSHMGRTTGVVAGVERAARQLAAAGQPVTLAAVAGRTGATPGTIGVSLARLRRRGEIPPAPAPTPPPRRESAGRRAVRLAVARLAAAGTRVTATLVAAEAGMPRESASRHLQNLRRSGEIPAYSPPPRKPREPREPREPKARAAPPPAEPRDWLPTSEEVEAAKAEIRLSLSPPSPPSDPGPPETWAPADACRLYLEEWRTGRVPHFMASKHQLDQLDDHDAA